jgi:extradiol dioxygenase family protein
VVRRGRSDTHWVVQFSGISWSVTSIQGFPGPASADNFVDGYGVPVPHFGLVLDMQSWESMCDRLRAAGIEFLIEPTVRFKGKVGEQATMFFRDPAGNNLEIKAFERLDRLFAR